MRHRQQPQEQTPPPAQQRRAEKAHLRQQRRQQKEARQKAQAQARREKKAQGKGVNTKALWTSVIAVALVALLGSIAVDTQSAWYQSLPKPPFAPAPFVFPIAWSLIYASVCYALYLVLASKSPCKKGAWVPYLANGVCNAAWPWVFFQARQPALAVGVILAMGASILWMMARSLRVRRGAAWLLVPYLAWTAFAFVLNYTIAMMA
nr:TspO/MBR family protein [Maliibacterium massiliense]